MRRAALVALVVAAGCKGGGRAGDMSGSDHAGAAGSATRAPAADAAVDANLDHCRAALAEIAGRPPAERPQALIDACQPCGDWSILLAWNTPATEGGPSHAALEAAMQACHGYCNGNARQRFLGVLDTARGEATRGPWRLLGEACKAEVSAEPDARYMSAPFFALDRIARAVGDAGPAITVPLPAVSVTGVGVELPAANQGAPGSATGSAPPPVAPPPVAIDSDAGAIALTVDAHEVLIGRLPSAALSSHGLAVTGDYPGKVVPIDQLAAQLAALAKADPRPILIIAPHALPAARVAEVVTAARGAALRLAVAAPSPRGWSLPAAIPLHLIATPGRGAATIALAPGDKVDELVARLTAAMAPGITSAALVR